MFAIDYDEILIIKINNKNKYEYATYEKHGTFDEAKEDLIDYWQLSIGKAKQGLKEAKKIKKI